MKKTRASIGTKAEIIKYKRTQSQMRRTSTEMTAATRSSRTTSTRRKITSRFLTLQSKDMKPVYVQHLQISEKIQRRTKQKQCCTSFWVSSELATLLPALLLDATHMTRSVRIHLRFQIWFTIGNRSQLQTLRQWMVTFVRTATSPCWLDTGLAPSQGVHEMEEKLLLLELTIVKNHALK